MLQWESSCPKYSYLKRDLGVGRDLGSYPFDIIAAADSYCIPESLKVPLKHLKHRQSRVSDCSIQSCLLGAKAAAQTPQFSFNASFAFTGSLRAPELVCEVLPVLEVIYASQMDLYLQDNWNFAGPRME